MVQPWMCFERVSAGQGEQAVARAVAALQGVAVALVVPSLTFHELPSAVYRSRQRPAAEIRLQGAAGVVGGEGVAVVVAFVEEAEDAGIGSCFKLVGHYRPTGVALGVEHVAVRLVLLRVEELVVGGTLVACQVAVFVLPPFCVQLRVEAWLGVSQLQSVDDDAVGFYVWVTDSPLH